MKTPVAASTHSMRIYRQLAGLGRLNYRAKIMLTAFVGMHVPLIGLILHFILSSPSPRNDLYLMLGIALAATLAGTVVTLVVLNGLLAPVLRTAHTLRTFRETGQHEPLPLDYVDEAGTLMADAEQTLRQLSASLESLRSIDEGTGLPNRRRCVEWIGHRLAQGRPFAVAVVRLGNYSRIAETLDRENAERAAREIGARLGGDVGSQHRVARVGPSELAYLADLHDAGEASWLSALEGLRQQLRACRSRIRLDDVEIEPELFAGVALYPADESEPSRLLDRAVASARQATRGEPVLLHSVRAREHALQRFRLEHDLRGAVERGEFELHYQPVVDVRTRRMVCAEALVRWRHPKRGLLLPGQFIGAAESSRLIDRIGLWVLREACAQLRLWRDEGQEGMRMAVNLSARQFQNRDLTQLLLETVEAYGVRPDRLEIELTETAAMVDHDHSWRVMTALRDAGIRIAIDDFGTGYASMSYLRKLPFDKLKIDREFVSQVHAVRHSQAICDALLELARGLGLTVVAEGVELPSEVEYLVGRGCQLFQGFFFARPMPAAQLQALLPR